MLSHDDMNQVTATMPTSKLHKDNYLNRDKANAAVDQDEDLVKLTNDSLIENNYGEDEEEEMNREDNNSSKSNHNETPPFEESKLQTHSSVNNEYQETYPYPKKV